ncbi:MAG: methionine biosynthesis protein MetW [Pelagibacterales bacterium]|nr:methionine biosynthesis protein MetW [Pelagibacterales bacterium]|tara:strand:- start:20514 stop:21128 length:615 start_codon:yes stop_codon:yes gene_type:complete
MENRVDHNIITNIVKKNSRVLDIGCADGTLLKILKSQKNISGQGIEIDHIKVENCLRKGLSVVEGDANFEIVNFPDYSFDYVILSQTLQTVARPKWVLKEILRIGKNAIISFPNFGHWLCRFQLFLNGKMPVTEDLKLSWYDTQNIHLCTVKDFLELLKDMKLHTDEVYGITRNKKIIQSNKSLLNIFAAHAVLLVTKKTKNNS